MFREVQSIEFSSGTAFFEEFDDFSDEASSFRVFDLGTPDDVPPVVEDEAEFILFSSSGLGSGVEVGVLFSERFIFSLVVASGLVSPILNRIQKIINYVDSVVVFY